MTAGARAVAALTLLALGACQGSAWHGRRLLAQGDLRRVLDEVRPASSDGFVVRGAALRRLGRLRSARTSLLIGLSIDPRSAEGHRELAMVDAGLGNWGSALHELERVRALAPGQVCVDRDLALLLVWRAALRRSVGEVKDAARDLERARAMAPCVAESGGRGRASCPDGPAPAPDRPLPAARCALRRPGRLLREAKRRGLLLACRGPRLALRLERAGCVDEARAVWQALAREAPADPRWPLEVGRMLLVQGKRRRAELSLTDHVYLSQDRAAALILVARTLEQTGNPRAATRRAVEALALARGLERTLEALGAVARTGTASQVRAAERVVLGNRWTQPRDRVRRMVEAATGRAPAPRRRPRR